MKNSSPKPMKTNQWPAPIQVHCSIRVCPRVSFSMVTVRAPLSSVRAIGWPILTVAMIERIALTNKAMPTAAMASDTTMAKICMEAPVCCEVPACKRRPSVGPAGFPVTGRAL